MLPDPYILDAMYQARRQDELGTVEIDGRRYRAAGFRPIRIGHFPGAPRSGGLGQLFRRIVSGRQPAATAS
jgi:hypothetical protein